MTVDQIYYFLEIAQCGNLTEAAMHLHITQPTLSRQLTNMERELNMQLFVRSNHGLKLTIAGEVLYAEWEKMVEAYEMGVERAKYAFRGIRGSLSIGVLDGLKVESYLPAMLGRMEENYPNVRIRLKRLSFIEIVEQLNHGAIDIGISLDVNFAEQEDLITQNIKPYVQALALPRRRFPDESRPVALEELKDEQFVIVNRRECEFGVRSVIELCREHGGFYPEFYYVDSMADVNLWLETGLKCAVLNLDMQVVDSPCVRMERMPYDTSEHFVQMAYSVHNDNWVWDFVKDSISSCL